MTITPVTVAALVARLKLDPRHEGDLNEWPADVVAQALYEGLIRIVACDRPNRNMRLTPMGRR